MPGLSGVPFWIVPKSAGRAASSRWSVFVISLRSVMMSYSNTCLARATSNAVRSFARSAAVRTIGLSPRTLSPAWTDSTM